MLIVVTIHAEQLPVAAVQGIIVMVVISMVYREFKKIGPSEFPATPAAYPGIHLKCSLPVALVPLLHGATSFRDDPVQFILALFRWHIEKFSTIQGDLALF